jgi:hypothetical protein
MRKEIVEDEETVGVDLQREHRCTSTTEEIFEDNLALWRRVI